MGLDKPRVLSDKMPMDMSVGDLGGYILYLLWVNVEKRNSWVMS